MTTSSIVRMANQIARAFAAQGAAMVVYGLVNAWSIAGGAWCGLLNVSNATIGRSGL